MARWRAELPPVWWIPWSFLTQLWLWHFTLAQLGAEALHSPHILLLLSEARRCWFAATPQPCHAQLGIGTMHLAEGLSLAAILRPPWQGLNISWFPHLWGKKVMGSYTLNFFFFLRESEFLRKWIFLERLWIVHNFSALNSNHEFFQSASWESNDARPSKWAVRALEQTSLSAESQKVSILAHCALSFHIDKSSVWKNEDDWGINLINE